MSDDATTPSGVSARGRARWIAALRHPVTIALVGIAVVVAIMVLAHVLPKELDWNVRSRNYPPLHATWMPRTGPGTPFAIAMALLLLIVGERVARTLSWRWLLLVSGVAAFAWMLSLALVDGWAGIADVLDADIEYLQTARRIDDVGATLREFVSRIPAGSAGQWVVHVAGHPPGALLTFVALDRAGLGSGSAAGVVVMVLAASIPAAAMLTLRLLGAERHARLAAPFLVAGPSAIWMAVSADALFAAVAAWATVLLAAAATTRRRWPRAAYAVASGLLYGWCVFLSYGLPLLGLLAVGVLVAARAWRPLPWAIGGALVVVAAFAANGFVWWEAYPVLVERYYAGIASERPYAYWVWANLAVLGFSAGPVFGAAVALALSRLRALRDGGALGALVMLTLAGLAMVLAADLSGMSKAEVERIWLPFVPWVLLGTALLPARLRLPAFALQLGTALLMQHIVFSQW